MTGGLSDIYELNGAQLPVYFDNLHVFILKLAMALE